MTKEIVIVGGGFAGISAAKVLSRQSGVHITLIDQHNYHLFQPLLYQVATAGLSPADIAFPIRSIFRKRHNVEVQLARVKSVDLKTQRVITHIQDVRYDFLILACGARHDYFQHPEWEDFAPGLKTLEQATEIRRRILKSFERAEQQKDQVAQQAALTFVVVGGGPTGVELAGSIAEISRSTLNDEFRHIDPTQTRVILVEAGPRVLSSFSESLAKRAEGDLKRMGVEIITGRRVTSIDESGVRLSEEKILAQTVIWAAGVKPSSLNSQLGVALDDVGRVIVNADLSVPGHSNVFVLGDQAAARDARSDKILPGLAPVAMQQGRWAARNIARQLTNRPMQAFWYVDKGQMATIGRKRAVAQFRGLEFDGVLAWLAWLVVHIFYLIGFKNRTLVLMQWAWSYATFQRGARLILEKEWRIQSLRTQSFDNLQPLSLESRKEPAKDAHRNRGDK